MESLPILPIPPITRFDAVMWFLRVQLWVVVANLLLAVLSSGIWFFFLIGLPSGFSSSPFRTLSGVGESAIPVLVLWVFPAILASNALGETARDTISSLSDLRSLIVRCAGLSLLVSSLTRVIGASFFIVATLATRGTISFSSTGSLSSRLMTATWMSNLVGGTLSLLFGFVLAFGPAIRDSMRAR